MGDLVERQSGKIKKYNPEEGLKTIAVAEAAEKHFARAKDTERLFKAVETKLRAQAEFVLWWDGHNNYPGDGSGVTAKRRLKAGHDGIPERMVLHRWRRLLDEAKLISLLKEAQERCRRICELDKTVRGTEGTGENEWFTPAKYIELARKVLGGIDLDPATHVEAQKIVQAKTFFTKETDGLRQEWHGRVWLNAPYAQPLMGQFVGKLLEELEANRVTSAISLTHNYTDTSWFHQSAEIASAICFTRGRIAFLDIDGKEAAPTQGQAFFYFGDDVEEFSKVFVDIGFVVRP